MRKQWKFNACAYATHRTFHCDLPTVRRRLSHAIRFGPDDKPYQTNQLRELTCFDEDKKMTSATVAAAVTVTAATAGPIWVNGSSSRDHHNVQLMIRTISFDCRFPRRNHTKMRNFDSNFGFSQIKRRRGRGTNKFSQLFDSPHANYTITMNPSRLHDGIQTIDLLRLAFGPFWGRFCCCCCWKSTEKS